MMANMVQQELSFIGEEMQIEKLPYKPGWQSYKMKYTFIM